MDRLPAAPLFPALQRVLADLQGAHLGPELAKALQARGVEPPLLDRGTDRAAGLVRVAAVREAAGGEEPAHVLEGRVEARPVGPELDLAQARRVEEQGAAGQGDQLAVGRGVSAALVGRAHLARLLLLAAEEPVDQGGLADTGGAQERHRAAGREPRHEGFQPLARLGRGHEHRHAGGDPLDLAAAGIDVGAQVGLVEQHDREGPALPGEDERPLDPPGVEVPVEAHHQEDRVHVGGQHLGDGAVPGRASDEGGAPGQQRLDDRPLSRLERAQGHPVADGGQARGPARLVAQAPGHGGDGLTLLRVHAQDPGVAGDHAARHQAPGGEGCEGLLEESLEAEPPECRPRQGVSRAAPGTRP